MLPTAVAQPTISPFTMLMADDGQSPGVGSIWKEPASSKRQDRKGSAMKVTARRPLLANFMTPAGRNSKKAEKVEAEPTPLPITTPKAKAKSPAAQLLTTGEKKKPRKQYSTAGRPRNRGQYKCGKCGFKPKKAKHDCEVEKIRRAKLKAAGKGSEDDNYDDDDDDECGHSPIDGPPGRGDGKPDRQRLQPPPPPQL